MSTITVTNLGKAYKLYPARWSRLAEWLLPGHKPRHQLKWALHDITFTVNPGEAVGIIGVNGAGKSTLLKIITGTTQPTTGSMHITGRVAALLELGMGFHPDFTGRQNVLMAGQLQNLTPHQIRDVMPAVENFAAIGDYIDQPVRVYSSGMQMRLAFAVATAVRPDILIVDEALAVGDAAFQRKCFQRIETFRAEGTTLLFVSHDVDTVKRLCGKAVFLDKGFMKMEGKAKDVCDAYEKHLFGGQAKRPVSVDSEAPKGHMDSSLSAASIEKQYGDGGACIASVQIEIDSGDIVNVIPEGVKFYIAYTVAFSRKCRGVCFGMMIKTVEGVPVYGTNTTGWANQQDFDCGQMTSVRFALEGNLAPGTYYLNVGVYCASSEGQLCLHRRIDCLIFCVNAVHNRITLGSANLFATPDIQTALPQR